MLELICMIPDNIGWAIVGAIGACCIMMFVKLVKLFIEMWKEWHEEEEEAQGLPCPGRHFSEVKH